MVLPYESLIQTAVVQQYYRSITCTNYLYSQPETGLFAVKGEGYGVNDRGVTCGASRCITEPCAVAGCTTWHFVPYIRYYTFTVDGELYCWMCASVTDGPFHLLPSFVAPILYTQQEIAEVQHVPYTAVHHIYMHVDHLSYDITLYYYS